jgi:xanthine dehydrogenase accessory factor
MTSFEDLLAAAGAGPAALATVVEASGSTPRHLGARMIVGADGVQVGTVGGGRIEQEVVAAAREVAVGGPPRRVRHHLVRDLAMCCGGSMELVIAPLAASAPALAAVVAARRARRVIVLETPLDGGPLRARPPGDAEAGALARASRTDSALVEPVRPAERLILFGAGHVGRAIGPLARSCGFEVVLCDDGDTGALAAAPAWADAVVDSFDVDDVVRATGGLGAGDHVLIVTRDHAVDQRILEQLIARDDLAYLGMIGSRGKVGRFRKRLAMKGLADDARWTRLRAPIGLDLGAETPEEIAVAVVAELIALRRRGVARAGDWTRERADG